MTNSSADRNHPSMPGYTPLKPMEDNDLKRRSTPAVRRQNVDDCNTCKSYGKYGPMHDASSNCQSGKRSHCTCDTCF